MQKFGIYAFLIIFAALFATSALADGLTYSPPGKDVCAICGQQIKGTIFLVTDKITEEKMEVCLECAKLPSCCICGLPVKDDGVALPDGRHLCARDKRTAVLTADESKRIANEVQNRVEKMFARFTAFPTNVDVSVLDRIDVDQMFQPGGTDFESPTLFGCIKAETDGNLKRYSMRLMTGLPLAELQATTAHEFSHVWVSENVSPNRRMSLSHDAEEGFCELVAYLLMDSQSEEAQKKFILKNLYTHGQAQLFIEGNGMYGFDQILDWMQYGDTSELEPGRLDKIKDVVMPRPAPIADSRPIVNSDRVARHTPKPSQPKGPMAAPAPETVRIEGLFWGKSPSAIINGHTVFPNDQFKVTIGGKALHLHCLEIRKNSVLIENIETGKKEELEFNGNEGPHGKRV
jgi:hypothetical protein